jgi:tetratricopeptide (TPR) repeat protein
VRTVKPIDPAQFVQLVQPLLEKKDLPGLCQLLKTRWTCDQILDIIQCANNDARKVALLAVGLVGPCSSACLIAPQLRDPDPMINDLTEHALWSIWFRGGKTPEANRQMARGCEAMTHREFSAADQCFDEAIRLDPEFAEAYNQRALSRYLQENYAESIEDCRQVVKRMPCHFGAWAGMGHCYAHLGDLQRAVESYEKALDVNPHLECVAEAVEELRNKLG